MSARVSRGAIFLLAVLLGGASAASAGSARCWIDDGALVVSGRFADIAGDFLIDTAAPFSQINQTEANAAGFTGPSATATLAFAGRRWDSLQLPLVSLDALPQTDTAIVGVIGEDVLSRYALRVRFNPCRLTLARRFTRRAGTGLKVRWLQGLPFVTAAYGDGSLQRREAMLVSTGRWETLIPRATLSRTPGQGAHSPVRLRWIALAGRPLARAPAGLADAQVGAVGMSVWIRWRSFTLDGGQLTLSGGSMRRSILPAFSVRRAPKRADSWRRAGR